jgi:hypothetical protein
MNNIFFKNPLNYIIPKSIMQLKSIINYRYKNNTINNKKIKNNNKNKYIPKLNTIINNTKYKKKYYDNNKTNLPKSNLKTNLLNSNPKIIKKETIPKRIRELVWTTHNTEVFSNKCYVSWCDNKINVFNFQVGHDIPESKGGTLDIDNLKPICGNCNLSMSNNYSIKEWSNLIKNKNLTNHTKNNNQIIIRPETIINKDTIITPEPVITPDIKDYPEININNNNETNETIELQRNNSFINNIYNKIPVIPLPIPLVTMLLYPLKYVRM